MAGQSPQRSSCRGSRPRQRSGGSGLVHCQQAAEKSLKAFLVFRQEPFRKTHNLKELGEACLALGADLPPSVRESFRLTEYAWMFRYPGAPRDIEEGEAETALRLARRLYEDIAGRLPADART